MDAVFPSGNWLGIPDLDLSMAADCVPLPVRGWGSVGRRGRHPGTWHFYADDYRFSALVADPSALVTTGAVAAVEPNLSVYDDTPGALWVGATYRKRWVARYWQTCGVRVFVDCNLPARVLDSEPWRWGVPDGWPAWATRGYESRLSSLAEEYAAARSVAGDAAGFVFLVVGGGREVAGWCAGRPGVVHSGYARTKEPHK